MTYIDKMDIEETERIREEEAVAQEMMYDEDELVETLIEEFMDEEGLSDDDYGDGIEKVALERFNALPWRRVIAVRISLPEELKEA